MNENSVPLEMEAANLRRARLLIFFASFVLFTAGFGYAFLALGGKNSLGDVKRGLQELEERFHIRGKNVRVPGSPGPGFGQGSQEASVLRVGTDTEIVMKIVYKECGHEEKTLRKATEGFLGLTRSGIKRTYQGWEIEKFTSAQVVLVQRRPGLAPKCAASSFVGVKGGRVAVFYGTPDHPCIVKKTTDIRTEGLPPSELADLVRGIPVKDDQEMLNVLEGLGSFGNG